MNGLDFVFAAPAPATTTSEAAGNASISADVRRNEEDDAWGDFLDSSDAVFRAGSLPLDPNGFIADRNGTASSEAGKSELAPNRIDAEKMSQLQWAKPRGPVPLSVFGEVEAEGGDMLVPSLEFPNLHKNIHGSVNKAVNTNTTVGINDFIANLYRDSGHSKPSNGLNSLPEHSKGHFDSNEKNSQLNSLKEDLNRPSSVSAGCPAKVVISDLGLGDAELIQKVPNSVAGLENLSWNSLNLDTARLEPKTKVTNSNASGVLFDLNDPSSGSVDQSADIDEEEDGWEFQTSESKLQTGDGDSKVEEEKKDDGGISNKSNLSWNFWSLPTNGIAPNADNGETDAVKSVSDSGNIDDNNDDSWAKDGWEFKVAEPEVSKNDMTNKVEGNVEKDDKSAAFENGGWGIELDFNLTSISETIKNGDSRSQNPQCESKNVQSFFTSNPEETIWGLKQSSSETRSKNEIHASIDIPQKKEVQLEQPNGSFPLSFFGQDDFKSSNPMVDEDIPASTYFSSSRDKTKTHDPTISISDLISSLYSQEEGKTAINLTEKNENGFDSLKAVTDSNSVNDEDDSWDFHSPTQSMSESGLEKGVGDADNDSWEFQGSVQSKGDNKSLEFNIEQIDFQDLLNKLKIELCYIALNHLDNLKKTRSLAADSGEGNKVEEHDEEIQDLQKKLNEDVIISEIDLENLQRRPSALRELMELLKDAKFRELDSEYRLSERLLLAEKDMKSMIELLKHVALIQKIVNLGSSEQQSNYTSAWSAIASACAQELRHAASIWIQARENNVQKEILSEPQGKNYILAVGEIYRVSKIIGASTRLYKPWILVAPKANPLAHLDECVRLWSSSGLEEALLRISDTHSDQTSSWLLESIKHIDELDDFTIDSHVNSAREPICHISGLTAELIPGMETVEWNDECYLVAMVNVWANLISPHPPTLPPDLLPNPSLSAAALVMP